MAKHKKRVSQDVSFNRKIVTVDGQQVISCIRCPRMHGVTCEAGGFFVRHATPIPSECPMPRVGFEGGE